MGRALFACMYLLIEISAFFFQVFVLRGLFFTIHTSQA
ncbi:hypothetical protein ARMA_1565 [Ardenticatena maritima]|uniref:Uncharacterized protein n=1 Tax=Ardenticatena maritima TaxID=872965 RepID=A0A0M8K8X0_9CHLR|nr:hypothetical protein ARMA_1565 [Ardenticatena maritima]